MNIQIFGSSKSFDSKKAERWFKERRIKYQYIDLPSKGLSPGSTSPSKKVGFDALVNTKCRAYEDLYMAYITPQAQEETLLEHPELFRTPSSATAGRPPWATIRKSGRLGSESLPPDRILHRCGTDRWYSVHTMDAHGGEVACVQKASLDGAAPKPLSAGDLSDDPALSAAQCGDAGSGSGVLPAVHDLSLLIFVSSLLGLLQLDVDAILAAVQEFLPREIVSFIGCTSPMWAGTPA